MTSVVLSKQSGAKVGAITGEQPGAFTSIADVEAFAADLKVVVDWRDELVCKLRRAALRFELCGLDPEEQEQLTQEVFAPLPRPGRHTEEGRVKQADILIEIADDAKLLFHEPNGTTYADVEVNGPVKLGAGSRCWIKRVMRAPPRNESPAPITSGSRAQQGDQARNRISLEDNIATDRLQTVQSCLPSVHGDWVGELLLDDRLEVIIAWRDYLKRRLDRARLCSNFAGDFDPVEQERLAAEIGAFNQVCCGLTASLSQRRTT